MSLDDTAAEYVQGVELGAAMIDTAFSSNQLDEELEQVISDAVADVLEFGHWKGLSEDELAERVDVAQRQLRDEISAAARAAEEAPLPINV